MSEIFKRTELLVGKEEMSLLKNKTVAVFGLGGVGGILAEALARSGIGGLWLVDPDTVSESNINRQIIALGNTVGKYKADVLAERLLLINPKIDLIIYRKFFSDQTVNEFDFSKVDYIADAIDTVTSKLLLAQIAEKQNIPIISIMGTGNKFYPSLFKVSDISKTKVCPLCRVMRRELKARGISRLKVVYSEEVPASSVIEENGRHAPASSMFCPSAAGILAASEIFNNLIKKKEC